MKIAKRLVALVLCLACVLPLAACGAKDPVPEVVEQRDYSEFAGIVEDPKTWYENFMQLPIANENMTEQELRQLVVDTFKANLTFTWTPTSTITYDFDIYHVELPKGIAYSGLCYAIRVPDATCGTIWKILPYYDLETGALDVDAMGKHLLNFMSSACSYGPIQAWDRVSNSHGLTGMNSYNIYESNIVPVGPYRYKRQDYGYNFETTTATAEIYEKAGRDVMAESLAQMKPADGMYSSPSWHVMMCAEPPVVVRNADGSIHPFDSYIIVHEQGYTGTGYDTLNHPQGNGIAMRPLGFVSRKYTFNQLLNSKYIPFTIKELIGQDPVEPGQVWLGNNSRFENGAALTLAQIGSEYLCANYAICTMLIEVKTPEGQVLVSYVPQADTNPTRMRESMRGLLDESRLSPYADGKNTIHISARLSNGELLEAFHTVLKIN